MKRILTSLVLIGAMIGVGFFATNAFFSDEETSTGNTFQAGAIDLKVDSEAHYAGLICRPATQNDPLENEELDEGSYYWFDFGNGITREDLLFTPCSLSWESTNLAESQPFFNYSDLKPGDTGENTISLLVDNNPAWVCAEITVTADSDMTCTEPENGVSGENGACVVDGPDGEMSENLSLAWWADDGDNILDQDEVGTLFFQSGASLQDMLTLVGSNTIQLTLADSVTNFFGPNDGEPLAGSTNYYVGLAWCFGDMNIEGNAITCDGSLVNNAPQTDKLTADIKFTAVQERNNAGYECPDSFRTRTD